MSDCAIRIVCASDAEEMNVGDSGLSGFAYQLGWELNIRKYNVHQEVQR